MNKNLIGNAPHQVPSNADLGEMAYQDSYWVTVGNITVDYNTTVTGNLSTSGNLIVSSSTANIILNNGANLVITTGNISMTSGNIETSGNIVMTTGNISMTSGNVSTGGNINVTGTGNIQVQSLIISQGNIFCNAATLSSDPNTVTTRKYVDSMTVIFGI